MESNTTTGLKSIPMSSVAKVSLWTYIITLMVFFIFWFVLSFFYIDPEEPYFYWFVFGCLLVFLGPKTWRYVKDLRANLILEGEGVVTDCSSDWLRNYTVTVGGHSEKMNLSRHLYRKLQVGRKIKFQVTTVSRTIISFTDF